MSRITEALARARSTQTFSDAKPVESPWDLGEEPAARVESNAALELPLYRPEAVERPVEKPVERTVERPTLVLELPQEGAYAEKLLFSSDLDAGVAEQYRRLGASLHQLQRERGIKVLMVTSPLPGEGKTLVTSNIGLALSGSLGRRVLLIDGDLRRPSLHSVFGVQNVSSFFEQGASAAHSVSSALKISSSLSLIPGGLPQSDPLQILTSAAMQALIKEATARFDWVVLDTPPVGLLPDANLLTTAVDGVLMVVQAGRTPYDAIQKSIDVVGRDHILGVVLNRADRSATPYVGDYAGYYVAPRERG